MPRLATTALAVVILALTVIALGVMNPVPTGRVSTDHLGPDTGQNVDDYVAFAEATLAGDDPAPRWALLSLRSDLTTAGLVEVVGDVRVSEVFAHVALDRVQTPVVVVPVSAHPVSVADAVKKAAAQVFSAPGNRGAAVAAVTRSRLLDNCGCVAAALIRAPVSGLRAIAASPAVRAVEALPADAVYRKFSVSPLLPQTVDTSVIQPDDGVVPAR